uniref:Na(+)/H(+) exchange regulatory cofactor NHE-RF1-like n=1 Tax=Styela clava TaxID=7725 RepID=UPI00193ABB27|nr:Na(+)/H(+) exchange regulatory cofactor NHE-RF1-like [Styela clava]
MEGQRRVCILERGANGFGFVLCCENDTTDTYVLHVLDDSPASKAHLRPGDKIIEINEINVENECHTNVVKLLQGLKSVRLVVKFCQEASEYFLKPDNGMTVKPLESRSSDTLRPKLVRIKRGATGYDFVVKTVGKSPRVCAGKYRQTLKGVTGHFVDSADKGGRAYEAGLRAGDRIVEINKVNVEKESHTSVINLIRTSPDRLIELLVVDKETDEFFRHHCVSPSSRHLHGDLNFTEIIDKSNYDISDSDFTPPVSPYSSSLVSTTSTPTSERSPRINPLLANLETVRPHRMNPLLSHLDRQPKSLSTMDLSTRIPSTLDRVPRMQSSVSTMDISRRPQHNMRTLDAFTRKTEELIQELRIHNEEINELRSSLSYSKSYVEPSLRDKYLNLGTNSRDTGSNPGSPQFTRNYGNRSTTSSSDDDHSFTYNNNNLHHVPYSTYKRPPVRDLSEVGYNVDLSTLKEHARRQVGKNKNVYRDKVGFDNYWAAHRAVNNM